MKALKIMLTLMLVFSMALATACRSAETPGTSPSPEVSSETEGTTGTAAGEADISGSYFVDLSPGGMNLTIYLMITGDTFLLSNKLEGGDNKGSGTVAGKDGTYMLLYKEDNKKATFSVDADGNLEFSTRMPYGTTNLGFDDAKFVAVKINGDGSNVVKAEEEAPNMAAQFAGKYGVDLAPHGMAMMVYLFIDEEGNFTLYNKYENGDEKGKGKVEVSMGKIELVYTDGTRLGFKSEDGTLTFDGKLPYGTGMKLGSDDASIPVQATLLPADYKPEDPATTAQKTDEAKPTDTATAEAKPTETKTPEVKPTETTTPEVKPTETKTPEVKPTETKTPEVKPTETKTPETKPADTTLGVYTFSEEVDSAVMGKMTYSVTLELKDGNAFSAKSTIKTGRGDSDSEFSGTFKVENNVLTLSYDGKTATASVSGNAITFGDPTVFFARSSYASVTVTKGK